jgi:hypothetical protein
MWISRQFGTKKAQFHGVRSQKAYISAGLATSALAQQALTGDPDSNSDKYAIIIMHLGNLYAA